MELMNRLNQALLYIKGRTAFRPKIGVILGSGLGEYGDTLENAQVIDYKDIPNMPLSTVEGHAGRFILTDKVICMQGRFHFYEGYKMEDVTFPIRVMALLGIKTLIVTNAAGGINPSFCPGDLMLITDHINLMGTSPLMGKNLDQFGPRFPDMSLCYDKSLISLAKECAVSQDLKLQEGIYCAMTGPNYETPAEIRMLRVMGGDAVGMSTVPEVIVANHCGLRVLGISCITNLAAGVSDVPLNHEEVIETSQRVKNSFIGLVSDFIERV